MSFERKRIHEYENRIEELTQALEDAVYLLDPTEEDMQKKAGVYRIVTALEKLKEKERMNDLERLCRIMGTFDLATGHAETMSDALDALEEELRDVLSTLRTGQSILVVELDEAYNEIKSLKQQLKEKNT